MTTGQSLISQFQETSHKDPASQLLTVIADSNEYTYTVATSNRYETLSEENRSIIESMPPNTQPNPSSRSTTTSSPTATRTHATTNLPAQRSSCFYILLKSECVQPKWAIIKGTGAVVRRFDDKRNTATQVRPKPLCKQTNYRWENEGNKPVHQPHAGKKWLWLHCNPFRYKWCRETDRKWNQNKHGKLPRQPKA